HPGVALLSDGFGSESSTLDDPPTCAPAEPTSPAPMRPPEEPDSPLTIHLFSIFAGPYARGNQSGAGNTTNHDSGGSGQPLVHWQTQTMAPALGLAVRIVDFSQHPPDPVVSRLFRPPRLA